MSNATVVNATNSSGLSAGSPITIETGGDVEFVAAGKFTGAGFATIAFAPYVGGKAGAPTLITITSEIPLKRTSALGTGATQFVGWVADASGTWEVSGVVIGDSDHEALSDDLGTFPDVATMPTKAVKIGATAKTTAGVPYSWNGTGWEAAVGGCGASYAPRLYKFPVSTDTRLPYASTGYVTSPANPNINIRHTLITSTALAGISVAIDNFAHESTGDNLFAGEAFTVCGAIEIGSLYYPLTFGGKRNFSIEPWSRIESDMLPIVVPAGTKFFLRLRVFNLTKYAPNCMPFAPDYGDGFVADNLTTDLTLGTGLSGYGSVGTGVPGLSTVFGWSKTKKISIVGLGDSITNGSGDAISAYSGTYNDRGMGFVHRAGYGVCAAGDCARPGETAVNFANTVNSIRWRYASDFSHAVICYGRNDIPGTAVATIYAAITAMITKAKSLGFDKVVVCTLFPRTTSTDSWVTVANQTRTYPAQDDALNALIVANAAGADIVYDVRQYVADVSGVWIASGSVDGVHPSKTGHVAAANGLKAALGL